MSNHHNHFRRVSIICGGIVLLSAPWARAQSPAPAEPAAPAASEALAPITPADYGKWEQLGSATLSHDGAWLAYPVRRVDEKEELRIRRLDDDATIVVDYGSGPVFSDDDAWLAYSIGVSEEERERLEDREEPVHRKLGLLNLATGDTTAVEDVAGFAFSDDGAYLAMRRYPPDGEDEDEDRAADLVVRDLATGLDTRFGSVAEFAWQDGGGLLALVIDGEGDAGNGVQLYDPARGTLRTLDSEPADYTGLAWRAAADDLAVLRARGDDESYEDTTHVILAWSGLAGEEPVPHVFDPAGAGGFPADTRIVEFRPLRWAEDGATLFFGIKERKRAAEPAPDAKASADGGETADSSPAEEEEDEEERDDEDVPGVLVWHADDVDIIPTQEVQADRDRRENFLAAWHLDSGRFVRLGTELTEEVEVLEGDRYAIGLDQTPYERERMFGPVYEDVYVIDVESGDRTRVKERVQYLHGPSPGGRYLLYLEDDHYWTYDIGAGRHTSITQGVPTSFVDVEDDHTVEQKPPFGVAGWTQDDGAVLLYDKHDIWRIRPDGSEAANLTRGAEAGIRYRYVDLESEEEPANDVIDLEEPLYLSVYDEWTEEHGYARLRAGEAPERLVWAARSIGGLEKAEDAAVYLYRSEDFDDSPDYFAAGPGLADAEQVTRTNPFQAEYAWGRSELIEYENTRGVPLQGALFYPADYDPSRTYPMIVYIYEIRSPTARRYSVPSERDSYNTTIFTSQRYFVFQPDIVYRDRNPGVSAIEAIVPAVQKVLETRPVDPERVGLVGHSWGGYQTAFAVTQTDIFRAAVAGAPLTNLVSMYNSIYWRTGGTDARIFEISQGRMEVPPWEDMPSYVANSPLHNIQRMSTPLLVAAGTEDGAVEFNQAVEFYNAARRAGKDLVLLVYEGENHGISEREPNEIDYHRRVLTWFNHYLKGEPAPDWITKGVPYLEQLEQRERGAEPAAASSVAAN